jgi:hypothetical protein
LRRGDEVTSLSAMWMSRGEILLWCFVLIVLEVQHLKWIVWEHWHCRRCGVKHRECGHLSRLMVWL